MLNLLYTFWGSHHTITNMTELSKLNISNNPINRLPIGVDNLKKLEYLIIKNTKITKQEIERIRKHLPHCKIIY